VVHPPSHRPPGSAASPGGRFGRWDDTSRIPAFFRTYPDVDLEAAVDPATGRLRERTWAFDYDRGILTINNRVMEANRIDAVITQYTAVRPPDRRFDGGVLEG
jgi:hypothetical protein